jgi:hypothetical protein
MIGKILGGMIGERVVGRNSGLKGAMIGAAAPWLLRRAFTPLGVVALGAWGAKKLWDRRRARRASQVSFPEEAAPQAS